jgi:hypothetical protein
MVCHLLTNTWNTYTDMMPESWNSGVTEALQTSIARKWLGKPIPVATHAHNRGTAGGSVFCVVHPSYIMTNSSCKTPTVVKQ